MHPTLSSRSLATDSPIIVRTKQLINANPGTLSLAQGTVSWPPPQAAVQRLASMLQGQSGSFSQYGSSLGSPELCDKIKAKLLNKNHLPDHEVMVTQGANQACLNAVIAMVDSGDSVLLFAPYYFNHIMALEMTSVNCVLGACDPATLHPDLDALEQTLSESSSVDGKRIRLVIVTNPSNPSGALLSRSEMERLVEITRAAGCWLLVDETYEDFCWTGTHFSPDAAHCLHVFSFSKSAGMMGWRVGYLAWQKTNEELGQQLLKVQDTVAICASQISQTLAADILTPEGQTYVQDQISGLESKREMVRSALASIPQLSLRGGEGAIYFWVNLPEGYDDVLVYEWLVRKHRICVIPGSSCGLPGGLRVAFANLQENDCREAARRLQNGFDDLFKQGVSCLSTP